jgi:hypothetical protein
MCRGEQKNEARWYSTISGKLGGDGVAKEEEKMSGNVRKGNRNKGTGARVCPWLSANEVVKM